MTISEQAYPVDLSACEREPIHIPGSIQPHGFFIGLRASDHTVVQVSANLAAHTGVDATEALDKKLDAVIGADNSRQLLAAIEQQNIEAHLSFLGSVTLPNGAYFDALAHASRGMIAIEFEQASRQAHADFRHFYPLLGTFLGKLNDVETINEMCQIAANKVKQVSGFGRVMVYRFDSDDHGHVLAEAREDDYYSYLHQRFPASDVPRQARELYLANRIRLIADANYVPSPLVPAINPLTDQPTDLTHSALRSVSPVHVQYMKNMGTLASMSVSIVVKGRLWGLISCHNHQPKAILFESRAVCEQLAQLLALRIESREESVEYSARLELRRTLVAMLSALSQGDDFVASMASVAPELLRFAGASGAALVFEGRLERYGNAPPDEQIHALVQWLSVNANDDVFHTSALSTVYPAGAALRECASGVLAVSISRVHRHYLLWFRPEVVQTIDWAGDPHAKTASDTPAQQLTPRKSFEIWRETLYGCSLPWRDSEIEIAAELRTAILGIVLERAEQMAELAEELGRANKELEAFSYSVSHDLRAPMRHIVGFTDLLLEMEGKSLSERGNRFLKNIKESARFAGKLVDDLLSFSQMGRAALRITQVDMNELVNAAIERLTQEPEPRDVVWNLAALPEVNGDAAFLQLAVYNLLSNAIKYSRNRAQAIISISAEETDDEFVFHVADNGVGFNMDYVHKLFGVFQRLHRMEEFEGTGIGLANVRRIVERHGGRVWAHGVPDQGAQFSFSLPKQINLVDSNKHVKTHTSR